MLLRKPKPPKIFVLVTKKNFASVKFAKKLKNVYAPNTITLFIDRNSTTLAEEFKQQGYTIHLGNPRRYDHIEDALRDNDIVVYFPPHENLNVSKKEVKTNIISTQNVIEAAIEKNAKKILFVSHIFATGPTPKNGKEVDANYRNPSPKPLFELQRSLRESLKIAEAFLMRYFPITIIFTPVYISTECHNFLCELIDSYLKRERFSAAYLIGNGKQKINILMLDDLVDILIKILKNGKTMQYYLVGGQNVTWKEIFDMLEEISGYPPLGKIPNAFVAKMTSRIFSIFRKSKNTLNRSIVEIMLNNWAIDNTNVKNEFDWIPQATFEALKKIVEEKKKFFDESSSIAADS